MSVRQTPEPLEALLREQEALKQVATAVAENQPAEQVLQLAVRETAELLDADLCVGVRVEGARFVVIGSVAQDEDADFPPGAELELLEGSLIERAVQSGETVVVPDFSADRFQGRLRARGYRAGAVAPILGPGGVWGTMSIAYREPRPDMDSVAPRLERFVALLALGVRAADARGLDEARERLAAMLEWSDVAIVATEPDGTISAFNRASEALFGWPAREIVGRSVDVLLPPDRADEVALIQRVYEGEQIPPFETERVCRDGRLIEISLAIAPIRDRDGAIIGVSATARDLHDQRRSEAAQARLAAVLDQSHEAIAAFDADGRVTEWNKAAERLFGYPAQEVVGAPVQLLAAGDGDGDEQARVIERVMAGESLRYATVRRAKSGEGIDVEVSVAPVRDVRGRIRGGSVVVRDLREVHRQQRAARAAAERAMLVADAARAIAEASTQDDAIRAVAELLAGRLADWARVVVTDGAAHGTARSDMAGPLAGTAARENRAVEASAPDGRLLAVPMRGRSGALGAVVLGSVRGFDPDDRRLAEEIADRLGRALESAELHAAMRVAQERFRAAFEHAPIGMALVVLRDSGPSEVVEVNQALCDITGFEREVLLARRPSALLDPGDRRLFEPLRRLFAGEATHASVEQRMIHERGHVLDVHVRAAVVAGAGGDGRHVVAQVQDVTERSRYEHELRFLADHDHMTGLLNRRAFLRALDHEVAQVRRYGFSSSLLIVDIDNFKYINDNYGHATGDELLTCFAQVARRRLRETDTIARLGGDEFALLLSHTGADEARRVAETLLMEGRDRVAVRVGDRMVRCTVSVGVSVIEPDTRLSTEELLVEADVAMYDAKEAGRDRASAAGDAQLDRMRTRLTWSERIREALDKDGFALVEQPILGLAGARVERSEVLVRLRDGDRLTPPSVFLPVAERFGQIQAIDRWVIRGAIELLAERQAHGVRLGLEVNLSGLSISDRAVVDFIAAEVRNAGIDPTALTFEVTETAAIENISRVRALARTLSDLGCQFALDDFGSGFGSFYYLKHLPFDVVKIDGDFIKELPRNRTDQLTVQAIVQIARGLGNATVAEFVQDDDTIELLREYGVDYAQGYHVGKPRPVLLRPAFGLA